MLEIVILLFIRPPTHIVLVIQGIIYIMYPQAQTSTSSAALYTNYKIDGGFGELVRSGQQVNIMSHHRQGTLSLFQMVD